MPTCAPPAISRWAWATISNPDIGEHEIVPLATWIMAAVMAVAGLAEAAETRAGVAPPQVNSARSETCVEPTAEMRRNHMDMLLHQRDQTMRRGIRTSQHSLKHCVACHANPTTNSVLGKDGFCQSCHTYTAVRIDCFECHSPSPQKVTGGAKAAAVGPDGLPASPRAISPAPPVGVAAAGARVR